MWVERIHEFLIERERDVYNVEYTAYVEAALCEEVVGNSNLFGVVHWIHACMYWRVVNVKFNTRTSRERERDRDGLLMSFLLEAHFCIQSRENCIFHFIVPTKCIQSWLWIITCIPLNIVLNVIVWITTINLNFSSGDLPSGSQAQWIYLLPYLIAVCLNVLFIIYINAVTGILGFCVCHSFLRFFYFSRYTFLVSLALLILHIAIKLILVDSSRVMWRYHSNFVLEELSLRKKKDKDIFLYSSRHVILQRHVQYMFNDEMLWKESVSLNYGSFDSHYSRKWFSQYYIKMLKAIGVLFTFSLLLLTKYSFEDLDLIHSTVEKGMMMERGRSWRKNWVKERERQRKKELFQVIPENYRYE